MSTLKIALKTCNMHGNIFKFHFCLEEWQWLLLQWGSKYQREKERKREWEKKKKKTWKIHDEISKMKENDNRGANHMKCFVVENGRFCLFHLDFHWLLWSHGVMKSTSLLLNSFLQHLCYNTQANQRLLYFKCILSCNRSIFIKNFTAEFCMAYQKSPPNVPNRPNHNPFLFDFKSRYEFFLLFNTFEI